MMVDSGLALERGAADNVSPEKDHEVNSNYASGRWKRLAVNQWIFSPFDL